MPTASHHEGRFRVSLPNSNVVLRCMVNSHCRAPLWASFPGGLCRPTMFGGGPGIGGVGAQRNGAQAITDSSFDSSAAISLPSNEAQPMMLPISGEQEHFVLEKRKLKPNDEPASRQLVFMNKQGGPTSSFTATNWKDLQRPFRCGKGVVGLHPFQTWGVVRKRDKKLVIS